MICLPSRLASPFALFSSIFITLMMLTACGDTDETCGGNGVFHGDHCDCDAGFSPSAGGLSCVADADTDADTTDATNQNTDATDTSNATDLTFNASTSKASVGTNQDGSQVWIFEAMDGDKMLRLEFYAAYGAPTAPGVAEITGMPKPITQPVVHVSCCERAVSSTVTITTAPKTLCHVHRARFR